MKRNPKFQMPNPKPRTSKGLLVAAAPAEKVGKALQVRAVFLWQVQHLVAVLRKP
jgi:hypothetical protein